jgi:hypothetical protein
VPQPDDHRRWQAATMACQKPPDHLGFAPGTHSGGDAPVLFLDRGDPADHLGSPNQKLVDRVVDIVDLPA